jgi:hypothetical protein
MVQSAPRYDPRIRETVRLLDDPDEPIAEICRRVGERAEELGLPRPSHVHLRQLVSDERARVAARRSRLEELGCVLFETYWDLIATNGSASHELADRIRIVARELVTDSH